MPRPSALSSVANPLILPLIYRIMRPEMEKRMKAGAASHLAGGDG
jgi:hypothetical protein